MHEGTLDFEFEESENLDFLDYKPFTEQKIWGIGLNMNNSKTTLGMFLEV